MPHIAWNKGQTKENNPSVLKTSQVMKARDLDNFSAWRERMKKEGKIKSEYPPLEKNGDLAELIGIVLGDGHIGKFPRTESLDIACNSTNLESIQRCIQLIEDVFKKKPALRKLRDRNCVHIRIYEKNISKRLNIPCGARAKLDFTVPDWILSERRYIVRYLRGLYEAEGSFCVHLPTSTYKFIFTNRNRSLLEIVGRHMKNLGFHPHSRNVDVQISRKDEVFRAMELLEFRKY